MTGTWVFEDVNVLRLLCPHKYLIEKGKVKIGYYNEYEEEVIKAILRKGELFGETAMLGQTIRQEFAQSQERGTVICPVPVCKMQDLMRENRSFSLKVYKFLGFRFKKLERRLDLLLRKDTKERLEEFLNEMANDYGYCCTETGDTVIKHPYTQKDIAGLIGTSRPTLNTIMNELKTKGLVDFTRNEIRLKVE